MTDKTDWKRHREMAFKDATRLAEATALVAIRFKNGEQPTEDEFVKFVSACNAAQSALAFWATHYD